jgi:hypothetical protein
MNRSLLTRDSSTIQIDMVTDPMELAKSHQQDQQFDRNSDWLEAHAADVYPTCRGKHICVAGETLFVGDTAEEALQLAHTAHPDDQGSLLRYIPSKKVPRVYAHQGHLANLRR